MPTVIELPGQVEVEFPDSMSSADIAATINRYSRPGQAFYSLFNPQALEPYRAAAREFALDVLPGTGHARGAQRMGNIVESFQERSPIGKVLSAADFTLEGAGLAADVVPIAKGVAAALGAAAPLIPMMARQSDEIVPGIMRAQRGAAGLPMDRLARMKRAENMGMTTDVYHGSTHDITEFDGFRANPESDWGPGTYTSTSIDDVNPNYAGEGPDLTSKLTIRAEQIKDEAAFHQPELKKEFENIAGMAWGDMDYDTRLEAGKVLARRELKGGSEGVVYPLKMNTEKYANIGGDNQTWIEFPDYRDEAIGNLDRADYADQFEYEDAINEMADELMAWDYDSPLIKIRDELMQVVGDYDEAAVNTVVDEIAQEMYGGGITATRLDDIIRSNISYIEGPQGEALGPGAATAKVLEGLGFEGVIDNTVDAKFGSSRAVGQSMEGVYPDTVHIVTFPGYERNLRSIFAKFDPSQKSSANILAGTAAGAISVNALMNDETR